MGLYKCQELPGRQILIYSHVTSIQPDGSNDGVVEIERGPASYCNVISAQFHRSSVSNIAFNILPSPLRSQTHRSSKYSTSITRYKSQSISSRFIGMGYVQLIHSSCVNFRASEKAMNLQSLSLCSLAQDSSTTTVPHHNQCLSSTVNLVRPAPGPGRSLLSTTQNSDFEVQNCRIG